MSGLSDGIRRFFRGRRQSRFSVTGKAMVLIAPGEDSERKVQVLDISQGGLAFVYDGPKEDLVSIITLMEPPIIAVMEPVEKAPKGFSDPSLNQWISPPFWGAGFVVL